VRILFLSPVGTVGGAERVLLDLIASLAASAPGIEMHLAAAADGPLLEAARARGAVADVLPLGASAGAIGDSALAGGRMGAALGLLHRAPAAGLAAFGYARRLRRLVRELRPDVIHSNGIKCHLLTRLADLRGRPVVWHVHDFLGRRPLAAPGLRWAARAASGALAVSAAVAQDIRAVLPRVPTAVVPNAVDLDRFAPGPGDGAWLDHLAGLPPAAPDVVRVGLVATFARWKGQDVFLRAASLLLAESPARPVRFYLVGGPIYQTRGSQWSVAEFRSQGADLLAAGRLGFLGFREDTAAVYRALDVVVHASTQPEPFGLTIAEGMACGRAVIVARGSGASELLGPGGDVIDVPPGDDRALARAVAALVDDPARRRHLGERNRVIALGRFGCETLGARVLDAYESFGVMPVAGSSTRR
jgi:glycosyltransferase involved in cell wall biosynthesis